MPRSGSGLLTISQGLHRFGRAVAVMQGYAPAVLRQAQRNFAP